MKPHTYRIITVNAGFATEDFWICNVCGSSFGGVDKADHDQPSKIYFGGFLAGVPLQNLGEDCDRAKELIDKYVEAHPEYQIFAQRDREVTTYYQSTSMPKPRAKKTSSTISTVTLTLQQANAVKRYIMGDHFDSKEIDGAIEAIDKVQEANPKSD